MPASVVIIFLRGQRIPSVRLRSRHALVGTTNYLLPSPSFPPSCISSITSRISNVSRNEATPWITLLNAGKCFCAFTHAREPFFPLSFFFPRSNSNFGWLDFDNCDNSTTRRQSDSIFTHRYARLLRRSSFARENSPILNSHRDTFSCSVVYKIKDI